MLAFEAIAENAIAEQDAGTEIIVSALRLVTRGLPPTIAGGAAVQTPTIYAVARLLLPRPAGGASAFLPLHRAVVRLFPAIAASGATVLVPAIHLVAGLPVPFIRPGDSRAAFLRMRQDIEDGYALVFGLALLGEGEFVTDVFFRRDEVDGSALAPRPDLPPQLISDLDEEVSYDYTAP